MAIQLGVLVRNARLEAIESIIGLAPNLILYSGAKTTDCAAADPSGVLVTIPLPSDFMTTAANGIKTLAGTWSFAASGTGVVQSFRIKQGATCHLQGTAGMSGTDLILDNSSVTATQTVNVTVFTLTDGNP